MEKFASTAKSKIKLNIGGKIFTTSKTTLLMYPNSFFSAMLSSGKWNPDEDGEYFIDRNPKYFDILLDFMRNGGLDSNSEVYDMNKKEKESLRREAEFYLLDSLIEILSTSEPPPTACE